MSDKLKTTKTNPRGIPQAPFIEKVEDYIKRPDEFEIIMKSFQERLQQYKYMEQAKQNSMNSLKLKIPDIEKNLAMCLYLQSKNEASDENDDSIETNYELNDTLFTKAEIPSKTENVYLWLGAEIMLEYPLEEAVDLLNEKLESAKSQMTIIYEDLDYLRENITTMEVNTARLYNWDVQRRKSIREAEEAAQSLKI